MAHLLHQDLYLKKYFQRLFSKHFKVILGNCLSSKVKKFSLKRYLFLRVIYLQIVCFDNMLSLTLPFRHNLELLLTLYILFFLTHSLLNFPSCTPLRSFSDSVLHLFYTLLYTPCLLYSPFFSFSLNLFFFLSHLPSLTFSLLFSHFLPLYLFLSFYLSFIVLLFDSPSLSHPLLSFSPCSTTFRWEVFNLTDDQKVMT